MSLGQANQLKFALGLGGLMSFYGIAGLIVYLVPGQMVGIRYKILIIVLILLTIPIALFIGYLASRRKKKKEAKPGVEQAQAKESTSAAAGAQKLATPTGNYGELSAGVEEVVQFLKSSNLGDGGKDAIYSLPWYIVAGTPKSGKTSLVLGSNLNFQTLPSQRQSEQRIIRPTPNVDWRVASEGVFFDTAGRYQTEGVDADEWAALLETMRKARGNRPLDGMVLVVDTDQLLKSDERETEEMAKVLRARLDEVIQRLKVRFPVYVVFTHADAIEGFRDSFSTSKGEDKTLVWGTTIPLEKSENAQAMFDGEYEILHNSVMKRRLLRLSAPFPPVRQLRIFNFPLHFGSARRKLGAFMNSLFRPNPFSENPFLRGYYFTAAPATKAATGVKSAGNPYFTERLFKDVILRDKDLVRTFLAQRQKAPIFGWFLTLLALFITFVLLVMSGLSLYNNRQMLNEAKDYGEKLLTIVKSDAGKNTLEKKEDEVRRELNSADDLRELLVKLDYNERNGAPFYMRFGLYSGNRIYKQQLLKIYMTVIEQRFKKPTIQKVEADLRKFAASQPVANPGLLTEKEEQNLGKNYDLLKAYLMLTGEYKLKAEPTHLANTLKDYWISESKIPPDMNLTALAQLDFWAKQVDRDDDDFRFPRISPDPKLVTDVREKLKLFPAWQRYYRRKVSEISKQVDDKDGLTTAAAILTKNGADSSLLEGSYAVPSAYTRSGYELMKQAIADADQKLSEDDWVMGETGKSAIATSTDTTRIQDQYYRDYAEHWRSFVKGVNVKTYKSKDDAAGALQTFSSASSPMKILLAQVAKNTNLSAKPEVEGWWEWIKSFFTSKTSSDTGGNTEPEKQFRPLFTFVGTKDQKDAPAIDKYQTQIGNVFKKLSGISQDEFKADAQKMANDEDPLGIRASETGISNLIKGFSETPSSQEVQALLQKPLGNLRDLMGAGQKQQIAKTWSDQILPAAKEIEKGFPYDDTDADVDLTKLTAYLNPNDGSFSKFYKDRLEKYFEESNGQLKLKDSADIKDFSPEFIAYLNNIVALRKALFGTNPTVKFEYEFSFKPVTGAIVEITIDGQKTDSSGTGSIKGTFPAPSGSETGVLMKLGSTSAPAPSAPPASNSAASNSKTPPSSGDTSSLTKGGTWGLFRFVDAGKPQKQPSGEYLLSYSLGGKSVSATIKASGGDLFDKSVFRNAKAPQNLFK
jgi:type VI secretion system protein ImpL